MPVTGLPGIDDGAVPGYASLLYTGGPAEVANPPGGHVLRRRRLHAQGRQVRWSLRWGDGCHGGIDLKRAAGRAAAGCVALHVLGLVQQQLRKARRGIRTQVRNASACTGRIPGFRQLLLA